MIEQILWILVTQLIDILVTIFVVDRLLKLREERQRTPSRKVVYARLFELSDAIFRPMISEETSPFFLDYNSYVFGRSIVIGKISLVALLRNQPGMLAEIHRHLLLNGWPDMEIYIQARTRLNQIIDRSAFLIDGDMLNMLFALDDALNDVVSSRPIKFSSDKSAFLLASSLNGLLTQTILLRTALEKECDRKILLSENINHFTETIARQEDILAKSREFNARALPESLRRKTRSGLQDFLGNAADNRGAEEKKERVAQSTQMKS